MRRAIERRNILRRMVMCQDVSPTSIRSRILKVFRKSPPQIMLMPRFAHVDPFEDTESSLVGLCYVFRYT